MIIYIGNINKIEKRHRVYTKRRRKIYEVIQQYCFDETDIFPDNFIKNCEGNANEYHNIPIEVKNNIKQMLTEQGLYMHKLSCFVERI